MNRQNKPGQPLQVVLRKGYRYDEKVLSFDILENVFRLYADIDQRSPPWTISHISKRWRSLSLATPDLWTRVPLPTLYEEEVAQSLVDFLPKYLARSRDKLINFKWEGNRSPYHQSEDGDEEEDPYCGKANRIIAILVQECRRWGRVELISEIWTYHLGNQMVFVEEEMQSIRHLSIRTTTPGFDTMDFKMRPELTELRYAGPFRAHIFKNFVEWDLLNRLALTISQPMERPTEFSSFQHLVALELCIASYEIENVQVVWFGTLPNVQTFSIRLHTRALVVGFENLKMPRLEDVRLSFQSRTDVQTLENFADFLNRHAPLVKKFTVINRSWIDAGVDVPLLCSGGMDCLEVLEVWYLPLEGILELLDAVESREFDFRAHTLHIHLHQTERWSEGNFARFVSQTRRLINTIEKRPRDHKLGRIEITLGPQHNLWQLLAALEHWKFDPPQTVGDLYGKGRRAVTLCAEEMRRIHDFAEEDTEPDVLRHFDAEETNTIKRCMDLIYNSLLLVEVYYVSEAIMEESATH
ncbi:hypothetical protein NP233_g12742 [Leucocoprinus birnbaumii]|uniref:F-box domain-containing protein n=1 Tax=Leucocoprinus birnbaumii TaxID=56174 RepID=A0AAD5VE27_9AGAR|nr:hypothetical protein NP233_g12742 [Leucocoprinus birnbaumii]